jgi:hypothetical protein
MSLKTEIQAICETAFGIRPDNNDRRWKEFNPLKTRFRHFPLVSAFEKWASDHKYRTVRWPLAEFLQVAEEYLGGAPSDSHQPASYIAIRSDEGVNELCADLCLIGEEAFTGRQRAAIAELLKGATAKEIKDAYTEFISNCDEFAMKTAVKRFAEGGGLDFINAARKRAALLKEQEALQAKLAEDFQKERAAKLADLEEDPEELILP